MRYSRNDNFLTYRIHSWVFGYNEKKYWKKRNIVVNKDIKRPKLIKLLHLIYCKKAEAKNAASMGTALNAGAQFASQPNLPHGLAGIFVSHSAIIGENCTILQNVTIGSSKGKAPVIGANCIIGAGAVIIGDVKIGNNCCIGANTTVSKDVPDNTTVVSATPRYIEHKEKVDFKF